MKPKTFLRNSGHEDGLHQGESLNEPLDRPPKRLLPPIVDRWDCVADHDVAEDNDPDRNESIVAKKHSQKKVGTQEPSSWFLMQIQKNARKT